MASSPEGCAKSQTRSHHLGGECHSFEIHGLHPLANGAGCPQNPLKRLAQPGRRRLCDARDRLSQNAPEGLVPIVGTECETSFDHTLCVLELRIAAAAGSA